MVAAVTVVAFAAHQSNLAGAERVTPAPTVTAAATPPASARRAACLGAAGAVPGNLCKGVDLGPKVYPPADSVAQDSALQYDCFTPSYAKLMTCRYGSADPDAVRVAFVGDNRAASLLPGLLPLLPSVKWSLTTYLGDGCTLSTAAIERCAGAQKAIIAAVTRRNAYDLVITTADRADGITAPSYSPVLARVRASGAELAVVRDIPRPSAGALACSLRATVVRGQACAVSRAAALVGDDPLVEASARSGATLIDLTPVFCTAAQCSAVIGNVVVYRDTGADLTTTFSRTLGPVIVQSVRQQLGL